MAQVPPTIPPVRQFMTHTPITIPSSFTLREASKLMTREGIRHLPVERGGKVVGILSDRDVKAGPYDHLPAEALMTANPYTVRESTPLDEAIRVMAEHRYGCVLIADERERVIGILTATDALSLLVSLLGEHFRPIDLKHVAMSTP